LDFDDPGADSLEGKLTTHKEKEEQFMEEHKKPEELLAEVEKLNEEIKRVREDIDQSYYRIPKKEFESITIKNITQEVMEQMTKKVNFWRNIVGLVVIVLSLIGFKQFSDLKGELKDVIKTQLSPIESEIDKTLGKKIEKYSETADKERDSIRKTLEEELRRINASSEEKARTASAQQVKIEIEKLKSDIQLTQKTYLGNELNTLKTNIEASRNYDQGINKLRPLLQKAMEIKDRETVSDYLDWLFRWTFLKGSYEDLDKLRVEYEKDYDFTPETWANIAIAAMFLFEENNSSVYKKRAIEAYEKALEKRPDYGLPHAVRLIIYMIAYERQGDPKVKEIEVNNAKKILNGITSGSRYITSHEAYEYLDKNRKDKAIGYYIDMLFENFPELMKELHARHEMELQIEEVLYKSTKGKK
jgi:tetratricopeptide (TPR) repeat protein